MPRRLHSQEGGLSWETRDQDAWRQGDFSKVFKATGSGQHHLGALGTLVPARANQTLEVEEGAQLRAPPWLSRP